MAVSEGLGTIVIELGSIAQLQTSQLYNSRGLVVFIKLLTISTHNFHWTILYIYLIKYFSTYIQFSTSNLIAFQIYLTLHEVITIFYKTKFIKYCYKTARLLIKII